MAHAPGRTSGSAPSAIVPTVTAPSTPVTYRPAPYLPFPPRLLVADGAPMRLGRPGPAPEERGTGSAP